jgi:hypothetical protein
LSKPYRWRASSSIRIERECKIVIELKASKFVGVIEMEMKNIVDRAYGLAGTAVVYFEFNRRVRKMSITSGNGTHAYTGRRRDNGIRTPTVWKRDEEDIIAAMAGLIARERFRGCSIYDYEALLRLDASDAWLVENDELNTFAKLQHIRARKLVCTPRIWEAIQTLAIELAGKGELSCEEAYELWFKTRYGSVEN